MTRDHKEIFSITLLDPNKWMSKAEYLLQSAVLIEPKIEEYWEDLRSWERGGKQYPELSDGFNAVYFMLLSYALENAIKALILLKNKKEFEDEVKLTYSIPKSLLSHDLYKLAEKAGEIDFAKDNEEYLRKLTRSAVWYGRYPTPKDHLSMENIIYSENNNQKIILTSYTSEDGNEIKRMLNELKYRFNNFSV